MDKYELMDIIGTLVYSKMEIYRYLVDDGMKKHNYTYLIGALEDQINKLTKDLQQKCATKFFVIDELLAAKKQAYEGIQKGQYLKGIEKIIYALDATHSGRLDEWEKFERKGDKEKKEKKGGCECEICRDM